MLPVLETVLGPGVAASLARTADLLREDDEALHALALDALAAATVAAGDERSDVVELDVGVLALLFPAVRRRVLRLAFLSSWSPACAVAQVHVSEVDRLVTDWHGQGPVHLPGGGVVHRGCGRLTLVPPATQGDARRSRAQGAGSGGSGGHG